MAYKLLKKVILSGSYDKDDIKEKLDVYYGFERITKEQYTELMSLVTA